MFELLLSKIASALKKQKVDYMVVGGQAVLRYGEPRLTKGIDITLAVDTEQLPTVIELIKDLRLRALPKNLSEFVRETKVLPAIQESSGIRVDFIFSSSEYEREAISRSVAIRINRTTVKFASLEDLIIHKIFAGRPRDMEDVKSLLLKNPKYDRKFIEGWLKKFDNALDTSYLKSFKILNREL